MTKNFCVHPIPMIQSDPPITIPTCITRCHHDHLLHHEALGNTLIWHIHCRYSQYLCDHPSKRYNVTMQKKTDSNWFFQPPNQKNTMIHLKVPCNHPLESILVLLLYESKHHHTIWTTRQNTCAPLMQFGFSPGNDWSAYVTIWSFRSYQLPNINDIHNRLSIDGCLSWLDCSPWNYMHSFYKQKNMTKRLMIILLGSYPDIYHQKNSKDQCRGLYHWPQFMFVMW